jgi:uncharacterized membrane-anchored protein
MKKILSFLFAVLIGAALYAGDDDSLKLMREKYQHFADSVNKTLKFETGTITLPNGIAKLNIPAGFKYLNAEQSKYVISDLWGNPPRTNIEGMIFPENGTPFSDSSYAFIISYEAEGYVKDEDADEFDYDQMLKDFHASEPEENKERVKQGYPSIHVVGWAQKPFYDKQNKVLHWAKELQFGEADGEVNTLNYDVRILGRKGILSMNAVGTMTELSLVKKDIDKVMHMASFTEGNTYKDFDPKVDQVAAWTIGGLVAGKVLAKVGLWAVIGKFLVAGWKFILIGLVAIGGFITKFFKRKKEAQAEATPEPIPVENIEKSEDNNPNA